MKWSMGFKFQSPSSFIFKSSLLSKLFPFGLQNGSSPLDDNEFSVTPQSPVSNWPGLDDLPANCSGILESLNHTLVCDEEVEQPINIPYLNQSPQASQLRSQGCRKEMSSAERLAAYSYLLERQKNGKLKKGATREVVAMFEVGIRSTQRLWQRVRESGNHTHGSFRVKKCGQKRVEFDLKRIRDIPLRQRTTIRSLTFALSVSRKFVSAKLKEGSIRRHTNAIKPFLTQDNLTSKINHCLSSFDPTTVPLQSTFKQMENTVHIDEKWFYLSKRSQSYYLLPGENDPVRTIKNSNFIPKVMFLAAVARPRYDSNDFCTFYGKIGVFPLVEHVVAIRSSQNRPHGTIEIKSIANITRKIIMDFMIRRVLPAIASKWHRESIMDQIFIQQDNAKIHIHVDDVEFLFAVQESGLNVCLVCQPPKSPDLNVLDLGIFRVIQSLQSKECATSVVELVAHVEDAYKNFSVKKSNYIFLTLQSCMIEVLKCLGSNCYKIPHMKKDALARTESLPSRLQCCQEIYANALAHVSP